MHSHTFTLIIISLIAYDVRQLCEYEDISMFNLSFIKKANNSVVINGTTFSWNSTANAVYIGASKKEVSIDAVGTLFGNFVAGQLRDKIGSTMIH